MTVVLFPLTGIPLVSAGDDLASFILEALERQGEALMAGDVVAVTGKVVSKAEGCLVDLKSITPSPRAERLAELTAKDARLVELVLRESIDVIRARSGNLLVRHRRGWVSGVAGIDRSNVDGDEDHALVLPSDPDASAERLRTTLSERTGITVAVVITDSHGRPFRLGNTGVAIGAAGIEAVRHLEGEPDLFGRPLTAASIVPIADLVASAAMLISGEGDEGIPVVVVRGLVHGATHVGAATLIRPIDRDMFAIADADYS